MKIITLEKNRFLKEIQLDASHKKLNLVFHDKCFMTSVCNSLKGALQTLNRFEEGNELYHAYNVSLEPADGDTKHTLSLTGNLNDMLSLLFSEKIITYENYKQLSMAKGKKNGEILTLFSNGNTIGEKQAQKSSTVENKENRATVVVMLQIIDVNEFNKMVKNKFPTAEINIMKKGDNIDSFVKNEPHCLI